jgi:hypothetical protein
MSYSEIHEDDMATYQDALRQRNKVRTMALSHYAQVAKEQRLYGNTYTATEVKQMLMDVLNVAGVSDEFVHKRAGEEH